MYIASEIGSQYSPFVNSLYKDVVYRIGQCDIVMISKNLKMKTYFQDNNVIGQFLRQKEYKMYWNWTVEAKTVDANDL